MYVLPAISEAVASVARKLWVTRQHLYRVLAEKAPVSPELWLRLQQAYDLWHAQRALKGEIARIPTVKPRAA
jgi:plasmid maintenance system antidote protein VapI